MTFAQWVLTQKFVSHICNDTGSINVFSHDPALWHLSDYKVSSVCGPYVVLVPAIIRIATIDKFEQFGPWFTWNVTYNNGETARIEMLEPAEGRDTLNVGDVKETHAYAIVEEREVCS